MPSSSKIINQAAYDIHGGIHPEEYKSISSETDIEWFLSATDSTVQNPGKQSNRTTFDAIPEWSEEDRQTLLKRVKQAGIVGMGGAAFPANIKLDLSFDKVHTLLVNAMECEPYITCDDRLLREKANEVLIGALIASKIVGADKIKFGIEDNKPEAISALEQQIVCYQEQQNVEVIQVEVIVAKTKYPSGGEKQLIQILTGEQVPQGKYPASLGLLVHNVATLFAIYQAVVLGEALTHRLVTLTGDLLDKPGNYWLPIGMPISQIISALTIPTERLDDIIFGGPLMGKKSNNYSLEIEKSTNCLVFNKIDESSTTCKRIMPCIRCGECQQACPVSLLPQQLYWYSKSEQWEQVQGQNLFDCIECGACSYVCPSNIELVDYFKFAKAEVKYLDEKKSKSDQAKLRFENRANRLERIKQERALKRAKTAQARKLAAEKKQEDPDGKKSAIEAALLRVKQKKEDKI